MQLDLSQGLVWVVFFFVSIGATVSGWCARALFGYLKSIIGKLEGVIKELNTVGKLLAIHEYRIEVVEKAAG